MTPQLAAQLPYAFVIVGLFLMYGSLVRKGTIAGKNILIIGAALSIVAALLAFGSVWPDVRRHTLSLPLALFNPAAMLLCSAYCVLFSYRMQRIQDLATFLVGDTKIIVRASPAARIPPADALLLPTNTHFRALDGPAFLYGVAAGKEMTREAQAFAPAVVGRIVKTGAGNLAVAQVYHAVVGAPMKPVKAEALRKGMESAANQARKANAESVVVPLAIVRGLSFEESAKATLAGVLKNRKAFAEVVFVVAGGRDEKAAVAVVKEAIGPNETAPVTAKSA